MLLPEWKELQILWMMSSGSSKSTLHVRKTSMWFKKSLMKINCHSNTISAVVDCQWVLCVIVSPTGLACSSISSRVTIQRLLKTVVCSNVYVLLCERETSCWQDCTSSTAWQTYINRILPNCSVNLPSVMFCMTSWFRYSCRACCCRDLKHEIHSDGCLVKQH